MTTSSSPSSRTPEEIEALQAVVDRVSSYQDGAPEGTVEKELRSALGETDVSLDEKEITALAEAIEAEHGAVQVSEILA
ncbi:hypothetical protein [Nocardioides nanhaiensis]|uniref:Uncharacterized protein n=1 Tax=Nocardioides nanhaiensis TaxID=1476871 RepID=A0ABP8WNM0_9ACTN